MCRVLVKELYTPCTHCNDVVQEGSRRFDALELPRTSAYIEPPRTFLNYIIAESTRCVEFFYMSSGWFDCIEPSLTTSLEGKQFVQDAYAPVRGSSSASNLLEPS